MAYFAFGSCFACFVVTVLQTSICTDDALMPFGDTEHLGAVIRQGGGCLCQASSVPLDGLLAFC